MILGCIIYPSSWNSSRVVDICETSHKYHSGKCRMSWAYILAIISIFDIFFLSILAFVLARCQATSLKVPSAISFTNDKNHDTSYDSRNPY
jgi:hypothetical protein